MGGELLPAFVAVMAEMGRVAVAAAAAQERLNIACSAEVVE